MKPLATLKSISLISEMDIFLYTFLVLLFDIFISVSSTPKTHKLLEYIFSGNSLPLIPTETITFPDFNASSKLLFKLLVKALLVKSNIFSSPSIIYNIIHLLYSKISKI